MNTVLVLSQEAILVLIKISLPFLLLALFIGLIISFLQSVTQMQEMTLSFVPKILSLFAMTWLFADYAGKILSSYTEKLFEYIRTIP